MARRRAAKTIDELLAQARATLPDRPTPAEALRAQASGALLIDMREDDQRREDGLIPGGGRSPPARRPPPPARRPPTTRPATVTPMDSSYDRQYCACRIGWPAAGRNLANAGGASGRVQERSSLARSSRRSSSPKP
jgi:hypothetical protein